MSQFLKEYSYNYEISRVHTIIQQEYEGSQSIKLLRLMGYRNNGKWKNKGVKATISRVQLKLTGTVVIR